MVSHSFKLMTFSFNVIGWGAPNGFRSSRTSQFAKREGQTRRKVRRAGAKVALARGVPTLDASNSHECSATLQACVLLLTVLRRVTVSDPREADMKKKQTRTNREAKVATSRHEHEAEAGVAGALAGAAMGAIGGPPGAAAGAVIGGIVGAVAAGIAEKDSADRAALDRELDAEIGVSGGELGAPNLKHPPAETGAYSGASSGVGVPGESGPAEGPMQNPES